MERRENELYRVQNEILQLKMKKSIILISNSKIQRYNINIRVR